MATAEFKLIDSRHPFYTLGHEDWYKWRLTYEGGESFRERYLKRFSAREDENDFVTRKEITPIPGFAKSAINDIRNSIFQRMRDITRSGGSVKYRQAISGVNGGVDGHGSTMNAFLGIKVLSELLVMGRVGVYVDNSVIAGNTLADANQSKPYLYHYPVEDILSWSCTNPESPSEFQSVLLRDNCVEYDQRTQLPKRTYQRTRLLWIDGKTKKVNVQFYDDRGNEIDKDGGPSTAPTELELTRIPFVMLDLSDSLIKDVCNHQIALLNLESQGLWYALQSNSPFYIEQRDLRAAGGHLKLPSADGSTASSGGQGAADSDITIGATHGRAYDKTVNPPAFIAPPDHPLRVSMDLQDRYEAQIRKLVNLSVQALAKRESAESKSLDNQGLESGLSFIGLILESGERKIAEHWASYESLDESKRQVPTIKYPDQYSLKTNKDRIEEAKELAKLIFSIPGRKAKQEIAKRIVETLLGGLVSSDTIDEISEEIMSSKYLTSDPDTIIAAVEAGLCGEQTGSMALGFEDDEYKTARADHAARAIRVAEAQSAASPNSGDPASRGIDDLSLDPANAGKREKAKAKDPTLNINRNNRQRGKGRRSRVTGKES